MEAGCESLAGPLLYFIKSFRHKATGGNPGKASEILPKGNGDKPENLPVSLPRFCAESSVLRTAGAMNDQGSIEPYVCLPVRADFANGLIICNNIFYKQEEQRIEYY